MILFLKFCSCHRHRAHAYIYIEYFDILSFPEPEPTSIFFALSLFGPKKGQKETTQLSVYSCSNACIPGGRSHLVVFLGTRPPSSSSPSAAAGAVGGRGARGCGGRRRGLEAADSQLEAAGLEGARAHARGN